MSYQSLHDKKKLIQKKKQSAHEGKDKKGKNQSANLSADVSLLQQSLGNQGFEQALGPGQMGPQKGSVQRKPQPLVQDDLHQIGNRPVNAQAGSENMPTIQRGGGKKGVGLWDKVADKMGHTTDKMHQHQLQQLQSAHAANPHGAQYGQLGTYQADPRMTRANVQQGANTAYGYHGEFAGYQQQVEAIQAGQGATQNRWDMLGEHAESMNPAAEAQANHSASGISGVLKQILSGAVDLFNDGFLGHFQSLVSNFLDIFGVGKLFSAYKHYQSAQGARLNLSSLKARMSSNNAIVREVSNYGVGKVARRFYESMFHTVQDAFQGVLRMITFATGGASAVITESLSLIGSLLSGGLKIYHDAKGFVKWFLKTKGVNRNNNAIELVNQARGGDADAAFLISELTGIPVQQLQVYPSQQLVDILAEKLKST